MAESSSRPSEPTGVPPQIITFYSYKGGTGRSMAVANTAWVLAGNGLRVLAVDWDLEAPGLHRYFHPFLLDKKLRHSRGVIDMITLFAGSSATAPAGSSTAGVSVVDPAVQHRISEHAHVLDYAVSLDWAFPGDGGIDFLPAGVQDGSYSQTISTFDWDDFYTRKGGGAFLSALRRDMLDNYDVVLIDSRTGLSDTAGICTVLMPDVLVNCFAMNAQSIEGAVLVARYVANHRGPHPVRIVPVPMRVERSTAAKVAVSRAYARLLLGPFMQELPPDELGRYWETVEIPYVPDYAHEEILAPFGDPPDQPDSLLAAYERLTGVLTDGRVSGLPAMDEEARLRWLREFERPTPAESPTLLLCHAVADQVWGEWVAAQLRDAGLDVVRLPVDPLFRDFDGMRAMLAGVGRVVPLLSVAFLACPAAGQLWQAADAAEEAGSRFLLPVRIDGVVLAPPFDGRAPVELTIDSAEQARALLLTSVGPLSSTVPAAPTDPDTPADSGRPGASGETGDPVRAAATTRADGPRYPLRQPAIFEAPPRNPHFVGRQAALDALRAGLVHGGSTVPQVLTGAEELGKTEVALEYVHRFGPDYDVVWWIAAGQPYGIAASLALLAERLGVTTPMRADPNERVKAAIDALRNGEPYSRWLLVLDRAGDRAGTEPYLPAGPGHVLVTTRSTTWTGGSVVEIGSFTEQESLYYLRSRLSGLGAEDAARIAAPLENSPARLAGLADWLRDSGVGVEAYLRLHGV
ncbi:KGGVGR-motif variant AAA ATPase [Plantactinospora sp. WMMB782]|uniref:KGGVGR-motif variant AAA ATPase n=1 Tax=Plantactinospora sp. WMMB782 TaxID=3404121 RepID=UPI003B946899